MIEKDDETKVGAVFFGIFVGRSKFFLFFLKSADDEPNLFFSKKIARVRKNAFTDLGLIY